MNTIPEPSTATPTIGQTWSAGHSQTLWMCSLGAQEEIRREVAATLHGLVQTRIVAMWQRLGSVKAQIPNPKQQATIESLRRELVSLQQQVQGLSAHLYPDTVSIGLLPSIRTLASRINDATPVQVLADPKIEEMDKGGDVIPEHARLALYRIAEQALSNVAIHSNASQVTIKISDSANSIDMTIQDDGQGFALGETTLGNGIYLMKEYASAAEGSLTIESSPAQGCCVHAIIPLAGTQAQPNPDVSVSDFSHTTPSPGAPSS